ncbi:hypothetical protein SAZ11_52835 [Streptomyces sp. FXJ1.4098]|nr:hypothetical protein [Streptomyces sp. FXJ1.4098]
MSSARTAWISPSRRPRLTHCTTNRKRIGRGSRPRASAMRQVAACEAAGRAVAQAMRSAPAAGEEAAAQSPAA